MKKLSLRNLSFVLIHLGVICLVLSYIYGAVSPLKYSKNIKLKLHKPVYIGKLNIAAELEDYKIKYSENRNLEEEFEGYISFYKPDFNASTDLLKSISGNGITIKKIKTGKVKFNSPLNLYGYNFYLLKWNVDKNSCYCDILINYTPEYPFIIFSYFMIALGLLIGLFKLQWARGRGERFVRPDGQDVGAGLAPARGQTVKIIGILLAGYILTLGVIIVKKYLQAGYPPFSSVGETFLFLLFFTAIILLYLILTNKNKILAFGGLVFILSINLAALFFLKPPRVLPAILNTELFYIHAAFSMIAYAFLFVLFLISLLYFIFKVRVPQFEIIYRAGVFFYFIIILTGSIWAQNAWGSYWSWDPKETAALLVFLTYAAGLHFKPRWRCYFGAFGILALLFCYLGVSFLMKGLHSY